MLINKGVVNEIGVTVQEQTTLTGNVVYLFEFISKQKKSPVYCIAENISTIKSRIDIFNIEETDTPDAELGQVSLEEGEYSYNIYQQLSTTNLNPLNTTPALYNDYVETGVLVVPSAGNDINQYEGATLTNKVYEG